MFAGRLFCFCLQVAVDQACAERLRPLLVDLLIGSPQQHEKFFVSLARSGTEPLTAV